MLDCLLIDTEITTEVLKCHRNLSMAWLDFSKAFDKIPHKIIKSFIEVSSLSMWVKDTILSLINKWRTRVKIRADKQIQRSRKIRYFRGLMQGDALSPIVFCWEIARISHALRKLDNGFKSAFGIKVTNLFYVDDIKIYATLRNNLNFAMTA